MTQTHCNDDDIQGMILRLREEHRDLDTAIEALETQKSTDTLQIQRLKKKRLMLRDQISRLQDMMFPDILA